MRKIAILSDIHGNLPAFTAVLREAQQGGAESVVFLGDIVGYGASPAECVALVRQLGGHCVIPLCLLSSLSGFKRIGGSLAHRQAASPLRMQGDLLRQRPVQPRRSPMRISFTRVTDAGLARD